MGKGSVENAIRFANELHSLLELEFEALKAQKLSEIESIQEKSGGKCIWIENEID